jgi:HTH-type transcriptional regulator, global nitrogen regulator NrpRI
MSNETDRKMMEILRILGDENNILGAKTIAEELKRRGYNLGERAVRYHMRILDEKGLTERIGYAGRKITEKGLKELDRGLIYDQVDFIFSKFEEMIQLTTLNPRTSKGSVIVNTSTFSYDEKIMELIKKVFSKGISVSPYIKIYDKFSEKGENDNEISLDTICGTTIDGMLLNEGIPVIPKYGGVVSVEKYKPKRFTDLISYKGTSMTPLDAFTAKKMTSVLQVVETGYGTIPANFRLIPSNARKRAVNLLGALKKIGVSGLLKIGKSGESVLGIPVDDNMVGIAITGGISPLLAAQEAGYIVNIKLAEKVIDFRNMKKIVTPKPIIKTSGPETKEKVNFLLSKAWNLIYNVDFDLESMKGNVIVNISYIDNEYVEDALDLLKRVYDTNPSYCTSKYFKILKSDDLGRSGIATVCSLTTDGILFRNGISSLPRYGGLLEVEDKLARFVELTAYNGSSLDPHEIYISKNMTSVLDAMEGKGRILASLKEIPYIVRSKAINILEKMENIGFSYLKIGKPSEFIYNAKVERYHVGIVTPGGLNPISTLNEKGIDVDAKAVETMMNISEMEEF